MKRLTYLVVLAALVWAGWWFYAASAQKAAVAAWFEERRAEGWQASYGDLSVRGFPNRIDTTITDILLSNPDRGTGWEAPFLQVFQLSYKPGHLILALPETQTVILPSGVYGVASEGLRASVIEDNGVVLRANVEADVLNISGDSGMALAGLLWALEQQPAAPDRYRLAVTVDAIASDRAALPGLPAGLDGVDLDALVRFGAPLTRDDLGRGGAQPDHVDLRLAEYRFDDLRIRAAGALDVAADGRLDGRLEVQAQNWQAILKMAEESGEVPPALARTLSQGLGLVAGLSGRRDTLDLPLDFDQGRMALGPIPLGEGPRLRLP